MAPTHLPLFGGNRAWTQSDWTSSDDRVRGGASTSTLTCSPSSLTALFHGTLDITALGGAGFASQRTTGEDRTWDLSSYDGIELVLDPRHADDKLYTLTLKDEIRPRRPDGREQSSVSWEFDFRATRTRIFVPWAEFRPTYRGRDKKDAGELDLGNVKRFGIMVRSFFGDQEGPFELGIVSIAAKKNERYLDCPEDVRDGDEEFLDEKVAWGRSGRVGWFAWLTSCFGRRS
ncbi:hypothetical protein N7454_010617 [Penicillium verhagenii]|nr:hypothetical protein N7454_010617 [Penicillium verhagenii]